MQDEARYPLPMIAERIPVGGTWPDPKPALANSPVTRGVASAELVRLIDGQIVARLAEIDELTRIRRSILKGARMSGG